MKKRLFFGGFFVVVGVIALVSALLLFLNNQQEDAYTVSVAEAVLPKLHEHIAQKQQDRNESDTSITLPAEHIPEAFRPTEMEELEIDGEMYIGSLTIPSLELEVPVISHWTYPRLKKAPCRYTGSIYTNNLVIGGHNNRHFKKLITLSEGDEVRFTDINGNVTRFRVYELEVLKPDEVDEMINSDADLTLFTCTYGGSERVTVRTERVDS